jgi:hypothetical protein
MIELLPLLVASASEPVANVTDVVKVPTAEFSAPNLGFACLTEPQPNGATANWVELGVDYRNGTGVIDFGARINGKQDFAVLKDALQSVETEKRAEGFRWHLKISGEFDGKPVAINATIARSGSRLLADYDIWKGHAHYVGTQCGEAPPRAVHGYDALLRSYQSEPDQ